MHKAEHTITSDGDCPDITVSATTPKESSPMTDPVRRPGRRWFWYEDDRQRWYTSEPPWERECEATADITAGRVTFAESSAALLAQVDAVPGPKDGDVVTAVSVSRGGDRVTGTYSRLTAARPDGFAHVVRSVDAHGGIRYDEVDPGTVALR